MERNEMTTLGDDLPKQQARAREILGYYKEIGSAGAFGAMMIEQALKKADEAIISGDVSAMLEAYNDLKEIKS